MQYAINTHSMLSLSVWYAKNSFVRFPGLDFSCPHGSIQSEPTSVISLNLPPSCQYSIYLEMHQVYLYCHLLHSKAL